MFKLFNLLLATIAVLVVATACDENEIGTSTVDSNSYLIVDSSFTLTGSTVETGKILSRTTTQLLGVLKSSTYGSLRSDFVTEFMPASVIDTTGVSASDIDSVNIMFQVPLGSYTGDSITPMKVNVYRLNKNLDFPIYSDFDPTDYYDASDLLGSQSYSMTTLNRDSALYYKYDSNGNTITFQPIVVGLDKQIGVDFFNKYLSNPEIFKDPELFSQYFPGVYVTTSFGNGRVVNITSTTLNMIYSKHDTTDEGTDTVYTATNSYFGTSPEVVTNNNISLSPSDEIKGLVADGKTVIVAPAGYEAKITFPAKEIIARYNEIATTGQAVLNTVSMQIPATEIENSEGIEPPTYLLLIKESEKDSFFSNDDLPDSETSFYATYDSSSKSYTFTGLRGYLKAIIDGDITNDDSINDFVIVPIDIAFQSSSSSSSSSSYYYYYYYYYYYSSSSSTSSTPEKVTPQISKPAMVELNLDEAKIYATFSKKDFGN